MQNQHNQDKYIIQCTWYDQDQPSYPSLSFVHKDSKSTWTMAYDSWMSNVRIQGSKSMSLVGYSRRFINGFSKITFATTSLQKMATKFEWKHMCEESFQLLRKLITNAPMLRIGNLKKYLIMCIDVCKDGIYLEWVYGIYHIPITQNGYMVCYESQKRENNSKDILSKGIFLLIL